MFIIAGNAFIVVWRIGDEETLLVRIPLDSLSLRLYVLLATV